MLRCSESESTVRSLSPVSMVTGGRPVAMTTPDAKRPARSTFQTLQPKKKYQKAGLFSNSYKHSEYVGVVVVVAAGAEAELVAHCKTQSVWIKLRSIKMCCCKKNARALHLSTVKKIKST